MRSFQFGDRALDLTCTQVMGILNVTPDSFSDGGTLYSDDRPRLDKILRRAEEMVAQGATILDVGGESTRPGAVAVSVQEELDRVLPVVERISAGMDVVVSVDTSTPALMLEAEVLGAGLINDVRALGREGAMEAAARTQLPICLMHMQGDPASMQEKPEYLDVLDEVALFLEQRVAACQHAGIEKKRLILDPGFGFGKTVEHNLRLMNNITKLKMWGLPVLVGASRKSMIGAVLNRPVNQRLAGSLATVALSVMQGASIIRVHDVAETMDVVKMTRAVMAESLSN